MGMQRVLLDQLDAMFDAQGLDALAPVAGQHIGNLARPRKFEIAAAINRLRSGQFAQLKAGSQ
jgi:hypothetical protein